MTNSDDSKDMATGGLEYSVGYGRPPKANQFKKGQSGNPRGRPRTPKTIAEAFDKRLSTKIIVTENGCRKSVTLREVIAAKAVNKAAEGDHKFVSLVLKAQGEPVAQAEGNTSGEGDSRENEALLRQIVRSMAIPLADLLRLPPEADDDEA
jgi:hypothetical protein